MLYATVFLTGAIIMIVELVAIRLFVPYFGSTMDIVTGIISTVLLALGVGYYAGGKLADKLPTYRVLVYILIASSIILIGSFIWSHTLLELLSSNKEYRTVFVILSSVLLLGPTSFLMAMISPFILKLLISKLKSTGSTSGKVYAMGTAGSILGTLTSGYIFIPFLPLDQIVLYVSGFLIVWSVLLGLKTRLSLIVLVLSIVFFTALLLVYVNTRKQPDALYSVESKYGNIQVKQGSIIENGKKKHGRFIYVNNRCCQSGMFLNSPNDLYITYTKYFTLGKYYIPKAKKYLVIGGGGYSFPKYTLANDPDATVDVVEIDPAMTKIAKDFFYLPNSKRLTTIEEDGRIFLNTNVKKYDVIVMDVFHDYFVPSQLVTQEAIKHIERSLTENGVVITNIISGISGPKSVLLASIYKTYKSVFSTVDIYKVYSTPDQDLQSIIIVAYQWEDTKNISKESGIYSKLLQTKIPVPSESNAQLLTDNFAPVERMLLP